MKCLTQEKMEPKIPIKLLDKALFEVELEKADQFTKNYVKSHDFKPEHGSMVVIVNQEGEPSQVWVGQELGEGKPIWALFAKLAEKLPAFGYTVQGKDLNDDQWEQIGIGWGLATYHFDKYKKSENSEMPILALPDEIDMDRMIRIVEAICLARDLINTPALDLGPDDICQRASDVATSCGADVTFIKDEALLEKGYPAIFRVGQGSVRRPALIDLNWGDEKHPKLTLVGKGVVFDTGGLNLKQPAGMRLMKKDMGGSAVVLALSQLIMKRRLPVRLRLLIPTVENSPGATAYRPGDVIQTRKGITVEIGNTDAEGRVILGDALTEAASQEPDLLIDFATLTGACRVGLGTDVPGYWTPSDELAQALDQAAREVADPVWRMPLWEPYKKLLKSDVADLSNAASTPMGGAITAALYLREFTKPLSHWVHLDIFGWNNQKKPGQPKGGEATALRAVFRFLENRYGGRN